jgi:hypothetical protein
MPGGTTNKTVVIMSKKIWNASTDWPRIRQALKHGNAELRTDGGNRFWLVTPIDADIARQILSHPAVLPADDCQIGGADYQTFRWRSDSPARKAMRALKTGRSLQ